jgi:hypothetical protein
MGYPYEMCKIKRELTAIRRNLRFVLDNASVPNALSDCHEVLSQSYEALRELELDCLSQQNNPKDSCLLNEGR